MNDEYVDTGETAPRGYSAWSSTDLSDPWILLRSRHAIALATLMLLGYSLLLQEYVNANEADYGDCIEFQITCPACHEAVFKSGKLGSHRQFMSHYAATKSNVSECELRVAAITREMVEAKNLIGHGQTIEDFFGKLRQFLMSWLFENNASEWAPHFEGNHGAQIKKQFNWMAARPSFTRFGIITRDVARSGTVTGDALGIVADELRVSRSKLWVDRQIGFARDVSDHLLAPNSGSAWTFILAVASQITALPEHDKRVLFLGNNKQLTTYFDMMQEGKLIHRMGTLLLRSINVLLALIPYVDLLAGKTNELKHRKLLHAYVADDAVVGAVLSTIPRVYDKADIARRIQENSRG